jgi:hypothetical protein
MPDTQQKKHEKVKIYERITHLQAPPSKDSAAPPATGRSASSYMKRSARYTSRHRHRYSAPHGGRITQRPIIIQERYGSRIRIRREIPLECKDLVLSGRSRRRMSCTPPICWPSTFSVKAPSIPAAPAGPSGSCDISRVIASDLEPMTFPLLTDPDIQDLHLVRYETNYRPASNGLRPNSGDTRSQRPMLKTGQEAELSLNKPCG